MLLDIFNENSDKKLDFLYRKIIRDSIFNLNKRSQVVEPINQFIFK